MALATLKFDLNNEDDNHTFNLINKAKSMHSFIWDFSALMREMDKHGFENRLVKADDMLKYLRNKFFELIEINNLSPLEI